MAPRLRSTKAWTAFGHPDPADDEGGEADEGENCVNRSMLWAKRGSHWTGCGPAIRLRHGLPHPRLAGLEGTAGGQLHPVAPAAEAARLDEAGPPQGLLRHNQARPEADPAGDLVGLGLDRPPQDGGGRRA